MLEGKAGLWGRDGPFWERGCWKEECRPVCALSVEGPVGGRWVAAVYLEVQCRGLVGNCGGFLQSSSCRRKEMPNGVFLCLFQLLGLRRW